MLYMTWHLGKWDKGDTLSKYFTFDLFRSILIFTQEYSDSMCFFFHF